MHLSSLIKQVYEETRPSTAYELSVFFREMIKVGVLLERQIFDPEVANEHVISLDMPDELNIELDGESLPKSIDNLVEGSIQYMENNSDWDINILAGHWKIFLLYAEMIEMGDKPTIDIDRTP